MDGSYEARIFSYRKFSAPTNTIYAHTHKIYAQIYGRPCGQSLSKNESLELSFELRKGGEIPQTGRLRILDRWSNETERTLADIVQIAFGDVQSKAPRLGIGGRVVFMCGATPKIKMGVHRRSDDRQELRSCIRIDLSLSAEATKTLICFFGVLKTKKSNNNTNKNYIYCNCPLPEIPKYPLDRRGKKNAACIVFKYSKHDNVSPLFHSLHWLHIN